MKQQSFTVFTRVRSRADSFLILQLQNTTPFSLPLFVIIQPVKYALAQLIIFRLRPGDSSQQVPVFTKNENSLSENQTPITGSDLWNQKRRHLRLWLTSTNVRDTKRSLVNINLKHHLQHCKTVKLDYNHTPVAHNPILTCIELYFWPS